MNSSETIESSMTQQELWAESEAQSCDNLVEGYLNCAKDWHAKGVSLHGEDNAKMAMICMIKANCYSEIASGLRKPRRCRIEREDYESRGRL